MRKLLPRFSAHVFIVLCGFLLSASAARAQDYAGRCSGCQSCVVFVNGEFWPSSLCGAWEGGIPDCAGWSCGNGCPGNYRGATCDGPDDSGLYHYRIVYRVSVSPVDPGSLRLVSAMMTTRTTKQSVLSKRGS
jgi:hypothetical protein